ncbi:unnamed protein product [Polarella glacialis]|uniref:BTB domain-containing protein n=1 Tax=Polarella glacialis TaxID=89957 RepID=A0A813KF55_POLGL|nr:unnamed protein product [Polarella glacialis]
MLNSNMREATGRIEIADFSDQAVEAFLRFMYSGRLVVKSGRLLEVAALADKYAVPDLKNLARLAFRTLPRSHFKVQEMTSANFSAEDFKSMGRRATELRDAGFTAAELKAVRFGAHRLKAQGCRFLGRGHVGGG